MAGELLGLRQDYWHCLPANLEEDNVGAVLMGTGRFTEGSSIRSTGRIGCR